MSLPWPVALGVDVVVVVVWSVGVGWWMAHRPVERLTGRSWLLRLRPFEAGGGVYERALGIRRWKDRLPEAGTWFGGVSKRHLPAWSGPGLARYRVECVRAEQTHWLALAVLPLLFVWSPWWLALCLLMGGLVANGPCILVPRYNRARVDGVLARAAGRQPADRA